MTGWWRRLDRLGHMVVIAGVLVLAVGLTAVTWWWNTYWGQWVSQNVLPPSLWTLLGIGIAHLQLHKKLDAHHEDMKQHVTERTGQ